MPVSALCLLVQVSKVVVKPSGPSWYGSRGVVFRAGTDVDGVVEAVQSLRTQLQFEDTILIEEFLTTFFSQKVMTCLSTPSPLYPALPLHP